MVAEYPDSSKRSDALLKLGLIEQNLGNAQAATDKFQQVIAEAPQSASAQIARKKITTIQDQ